MSEMRDSDSCSGSDAGLNGISREWNRVKPGWRRGGGIHSSFIFLCGTLFSPPCHTPMRAHPGALIFATQTSAAAKESQSIAGRINDSKCSPSADLKVTPKFLCRQGSAEGA